MDEIVWMAKTDPSAKLMKSSVKDKRGNEIFLHLE
jgi:hypothetical protein